MLSVIHLIKKRGVSAAGQAAFTLGPSLPQTQLSRITSTQASRSQGYTMALGEAVPITINGQLYRKITEGKADIVAPYQAKTDKPQKEPTQSGQPRNNAEGEQAVFYNPIQQYNRDLSVLAILTYGESVVEQKLLRYAKNAENTGRRKSRKKPRATASVNSSTTDSPANGLSTIAATASSTANGTSNSSAKRKLDDTEDHAEDGSSSKRTKSNEDLTADDVEVQQLSVSPQSGDNAGTSVESIDAIEDLKPRQIPFHILDALSASGLRAVRYAKEIPFATKIVANDLLPTAVEAIKLNIEHNGISDKVSANTGDAIRYMCNRSGDKVPGQPNHKFDVVDLDPYGTAAPFLDAAVQSLTDGGLLCVTCTDAAVFASNGYPEKAFALYNGTTLKGPHSHEGGLRLILNAVATTAAKYGLSIEPMLSLSIDFYARCFIRIHKSQQEVKLLAGTTMFVYNCDNGCGAWQTQLIARNTKSQSKNGETYFKHSYSQAPSSDKLCEHCGSKTHIGGPMWAGPLHHPVFVTNILEKLPTLDKTIYGTTDRIKGMLTVALEEESLDWDPATSSSKTKPSKPSQTASNATEMTDNLVATTKTSAIIPRMPPHLLSPSPFFFTPPSIAKVLSATTPAEDPFRGAFLGLGYSCTRSHCKPGSFKTNAPWSIIWEVLREWIRQKDSDRIPRLLGEGEFEEKRSVKKGSVGYQILKKFRGRKGDTLAVTRMKEDLVKRLGRGVGSVDIESYEDLAALLKGVLYEIERPKQKDVNEVRKASDVEVQNGLVDEDGQHAQTNALDLKSGSKEPAKVTGKALMDAGGDPSELEIVFDAELGKAFKERGLGAEKLVRYQINPRAHWGPMVRAGAS